MNNQYTVTILDSDTYIEREVSVISETAQSAHKNTLWGINYQSETITKIVNDMGHVVYSINDGFLKFIN